MDVLKPSTYEKRKRLVDGLKSGRILRFPGALNPLTAMMIAKKGFDGVYISGAVLSADLGLPDIGLTTLSEVVQRGHQIARVTALPALIDIDTGFGVPLNVARTIESLEDMGLSGCHLEDQQNPKRCGHLDHKALVSVEEMVQKIKAAVKARKDPNFLIIARTDARAVEGLESAIVRSKAYIDAGADMIFPEALQTEKEFAAVREALAAPLMANMTEFGKSPLLTARHLEDLGYQIVIYPVTGLRLAMKAIDRGLGIILQEGTQASLLPDMQTRAELYELLDYERYSAFDSAVYNFKEKD